jgi:hypothetical protein
MGLNSLLPHTCPLGVAEEVRTDCGCGRPGGVRLVELVQTALMDVDVVDGDGQGRVTVRV